MRARASEPGRRLLVVDDNPATLYATSRMLRAAGFEVIEAETGQQALERTDGVDLVVLDVNLPDIDGYEVCRRIRANPKTATLPVVHLSASFIDEEDREIGFGSGADGYLTHPVEPVVLIGTINSCLRTRRAEAARLAFEQEREHLLDNERAARADAERANELKDQFLALLSHELRNPLNAVVGWAHVLRTRHDDATLQKGLDIILSAANAQSQLISDLLDISRITAGRMAIDRRPVALCDIVSTAVEAVEGNAHAKGVATTCTLPGERVVVFADPLRLQQVVWNLLHNAVKFTPAGGRIDVRVDVEGESVHIAVADTGAGISSELLPLVFDCFRQSEAPIRRLHGGLGLGLTIVRMMAEAHDGSVRAESRGAGKGSTFTVTLPVADPASLPFAVATGRQLPRDADFSGVKILVVEDDQASREVLVALFDEQGARCEAAASVEQALDLVPRFEPDLLVSDISMPLRDGLDLIETLRAGGYSAERLPAIAVTAFANSSDRDAALAAGFQHHLAKPVRADLLFATAMELLRRDLA